jgi:hypothetical protein
MGTLSLMNLFQIPSPMCLRTVYQTLVSATIVTLIALAASSDARADVYNINRYITDGTEQATLTGTVSIPEGNYILMAGDASPFTSVNLTMTLDGTPYGLDLVLTSLIQGTGEFIIDATPTGLTFDTANADAYDSADLTFSDNPDSQSGDRYAIGYDAVPGFEAAYTDTAGFYTPTTQPIVFGAAVPEPSALGLLALGTIATIVCRARWRRFKNVF